jgi:hypothetical protein
VVILTLGRGLFTGSTSRFQTKEPGRRERDFFTLFLIFLSKNQQEAKTSQLNLPVWIFLGRPFRCLGLVSSHIAEDLLSSRLCWLHLLGLRQPAAPKKISTSPSFKVRGDKFLRRCVAIVNLAVTEVPSYVPVSELSLTALILARYLFDPYPTTLDTYQLGKG